MIAVKVAGANILDNGQHKGGVFRDSQNRIIGFCGNLTGRRGNEFTLVGYCQIGDKSVLARLDCVRDQDEAEMLLVPAGEYAVSLDELPRENGEAKVKFNIPGEGEQVLRLPMTLAVKWEGEDVHCALHGGTVWLTLTPDGPPYTGKAIVG